MNAALAEYNRTQYTEMRKVATDQAKADPSDPHTYNRVMSHLQNGIATGSDYSVTFQPMERTLADGSRFTVMVPSNMGRP